MAVTFSWENKDESLPVSDIYYTIRPEGKELAVHFKTHAAADAALTLLEDFDPDCEQRNKVIVLSDAVKPAELGTFLLQKRLIGKGCLAELEKDISEFLADEKKRDNEREGGFDVG